MFPWGRVMREVGRSPRPLVSTGHRRPWRLWLSGGRPGSTLGRPRLDASQHHGPRLACNPRRRPPGGLSVLAQGAPPARAGAAGPALRSLTCPGCVSSLRCGPRPGMPLTSLGPQPRTTSMAPREPSPRSASPSEPPTRRRSIRPPSRPVKPPRTAAGACAHRTTSPRHRRRAGAGQPDSVASHAPLWVGGSPWSYPPLANASANRPRERARIEVDDRAMARALVDHADHPSDPREATCKQGVRGSSPLASSDQFHLHSDVRADQGSVTSSSAAGGSARRSTSADWAGP